MVWLRKLVFYVFLAIYLICCPLLILYSLGYFFKPGTPKGIVKTGLIYLSTVPPDAEVFLGKARFTDETPALIRDLLPGFYDIRIQLRGHSPWTQRISVEAGKASVFDKILLLPENLKSVPLTRESVSRLEGIGDSPWIILQSGSRAGDIRVFNYRQEKIWHLLPAGHEAEDEEAAEIKIWEDSHYALLRTSKNGTSRYWWVDLRDKGDAPRDISSLVPENPSYFYHTPQETESVYVLSGKSLYRIDAAKHAVLPVIRSGIRGLGIHARSIYFLTDSQKALRASLDGDVQEVLLKDGELFSALFGNEDFYGIRIFPKNILLFRNAAGKLVSNRLPYELVSDGVLGLDFDESARKAVVWKKDRIGVIDFTRYEAERAAFEHGPRILWVYRGGENISQAFWVYEASHVLFRDGGSVFLLELETQGKPHLTELLKVNAAGDIFYSEDTGRVYFISPEDQRLNAMEVLPKRSMAFPFPDIIEERKETEIEEA